MLENHGYSIADPSKMSNEQYRQMNMAQQMIEDNLAVNLDETSPSPLTVAFREFVQDQNGYHLETVPKKINTYVPLFAFNNMLANQKRMQKLRRQQALASEQVTSDDEKLEEFDLLAEETIPDFAMLTDQQFRDTINQSEPAIVWQAREVLTIWKLTPGEGEMSLKRLMLGLTFEQIQGLFSRFFGAMLRQKQSKA